MSVTLDLPPNVLEHAVKLAAAEGLSLDELVKNLLEATTPPVEQTQKLEADSEKKPEFVQKIGRMPGAVLYMADDFDAIPEGFEDYI
jgi:hypothetical protein